MHDFADSMQAGTVEVKGQHHSFKGAEIPPWPKLALPHIKGHLAWLSGQGVADYGSRIDKAPDQPDAGETIDMRVRPCDPALVAIRGNGDGQHTNGCGIGRHQRLGNPPQTRRHEHAFW